MVVAVGKHKGAVELGKRGGDARRDALSPGRRREIATLAALTRWAKAKAKPLPPTG